MTTRQDGSQNSPGFHFSFSYSAFGSFRMGMSGGSYDKEVFLVLKEFEPSFSQGGDMAMDFLAPTTLVKDLETAGESAMKASLAKGMPHGYEVGYRYFTVNGRMLGNGETVRE